MLPSPFASAQVVRPAEEREVDFTMVGVSMTSAPVGNVPQP